MEFICLKRGIDNIQDLWVKLDGKISSVIEKWMEQPLNFQDRMGAVIDQLDKNLEKVDVKIKEAQQRVRRGECS